MRNTYIRSDDKAVMVEVEPGCFVNPKALPASDGAALLPPVEVEALPKPPLALIRCLLAE